MSKHTPGPWRAYRPDDGTEPEIFIARAIGQLGPDSQWYIAAMPSDEAPSRSANALLIAAAPDLLAALKGMVEQFERESPDDIPEYTEPTSNYRKAKDAIAKAEGRA